MLDIEDVQGKRTLVTRLIGSVRVEPENAAAALEIMTRFALDPRWLIYLPPIHPRPGIKSTRRERPANRPACSSGSSGYLKSIRPVSARY